MTGDRARAALSGTRFSDIRWSSRAGSTNTDALAAARNGAADGLVVVTDHQTGGRGRLGRVWRAPASSSLLFSVLVRPEIDTGHLHLLTMALGLAAATSASTAAGTEVALKWPNDLVVPSVDDRKVGGMLAESLVEGTEVTAVVCGLGLNVNWPTSLPEELAGTATSLNHLAGEDIEREGLLVEILSGFDRWLTTLAVEQRGDRLVDEYRQRCVTLDRAVRVELPDDTFTGRALDVTAAGNLIVESDGVERVVVAGDVVHLRPAH